MFKLIKSLFRRQRVERRIEIIQRDRNDITVEQWRSQKDLVTKARQVLDNNDLRLMLDTLKNSSPALNVYSEQVPPEWRATIHARIEGWNMFLNDLMSMAVYAEPRGDLGEPTFESEEDGLVLNPGVNTNKR